MGRLAGVKKAIDKALSARQAARVKGAEEMRFYENTLYHGTASKPATTTPDGNIFDEFKLWEGEDPTRSTVRSPVSKLGVSLAEQPALAEDFASLASQNGIDGSTVLPLRFRSEKMGTIDLVGDESNEDIFGAVTDSWQQGFDAIQFKNYTTPQGTKGSFVLVKNPNQIRSVNAAFDPAKKDSSNLLAGLGGAGIVGGSALGSQESEAGALGKLVKKAASHLDMRQAARMKRAEEMGFDTSSSVYHGTAKDFDAFDPDRAIGTQFWTTTNKAAIESGDVGAQGSGVVKELYHNIKNPAGWDEYDRYGIDELIQKGYDGIRLPDPDGNATLVAFKPNQYRSVNAAFDPAKKDSANLLAGLGGAGILGASMLTPEQAAAADSFAAQDNDGIYADEFPTLDRIGTFLSDIETPIPFYEKPLEGLGNYLQRFGEPKTFKQQLMDALSANPI